MKKLIIAFTCLIASFSLSAATETTTSISNNDFTPIIIDDWIYRDGSDIIIDDWIYRDGSDIIIDDWIYLKPF